MGMKYVAAINYIAENVETINYVERCFRDRKLFEMGKIIPLEPPERLTANDINILRYLSQYANSDGKDIYPKIETICKHTLLGRSTVHESLKRLKRKGLIVIKSGRGKSHSTYELIFPTYCFKRPNSNFRVLDMKVRKNFLDQFSDDPAWSATVYG